MKNESYIQILEDCISQMIKPLKGIPFNLIIKSISGFEPEFFDFKNEKHKNALEVLKRVGFEMIGLLLESKRPNEAGNKIENLVLEMFKKFSIKADKPKNQKGQRQSVGYPDVEFEVEKKAFYLECKTFNKKNLNDSLRTFYFSPSQNSKITKQTVHFMLSFEMEKIKDSNFEIKSFKIISIDSMLCDLKSEFNASNKIMYSGKDGAKILFES